LNGRGPGRVRGVDRGPIVGRANVGDRERRQAGPAHFEKVSAIHEKVSAIHDMNVADVSLPGHGLVITFDPISIP
jgi:hypothetical protein